jgi:hypothetical protein
MKFEDINCKDIRYFKRNGSVTSAVGLVLPGRYWVSRKVFQEAWRQIRPRYSALDWRVQQTAESLCGESFWKTQICGKQLALGRCVKYFVVHEILPLRVANEGKKGKRKYVRK